ncbi:unnamed protein product [Effrenium voratum]|nr:unnamed protein product [Effrenium voratum]
MAGGQPASALGMESNGQKVKAGALLWLLGAADAEPGTRKRCSRVQASPRPDAFQPISPNLQTSHGGYTSPATYRGGPPTREQFTERVRSSIARAKSRCRPLFAWSKEKKPGIREEEEAWIRWKLREEMEEADDEEMLGGKCSLIARSRGQRYADHGAARYEALANKGLSLQLGGTETHKRLDQRKKELKEKQRHAKINESKQLAVSDVEGVAKRRRAADILSELHKRTLFAELARNRESQEHEVKALAARLVIEEAKASPKSFEEEAHMEKATSLKVARVAPRVSMAVGPSLTERKPEILRVTVHRAKNLRAADANGMSDPFCAVELMGKPGTRCHTQVLRRTMSPEWEETFQMRNFLESDDLQLQVFDYDFDKNDCLGSVVIKGSHIVECGYLEEELHLEDPVMARRPGRRSQVAKGSLSVTVALCNMDGQAIRRQDSFTKKMRMSFSNRMQSVREAMKDVEPN